MLRIDKRIVRFNKTGYSVLNNIYGIGNSTSAQIWNYLGVHSGYFISDYKLDSEHLIFISLSSLFSKIEDFLGFNFQGQSRSNLEILKNIKAYRGIRYFLGLPIRGQRRHTNARTARTRKFTFRKHNKSSAHSKFTTKKINRFGSAFKKSGYKYKSK